MLSSYNADYVCTFLSGYGYAYDSTMMMIYVLEYQVDRWLIKTTKKAADI